MSKHGKKTGKQWLMFALRWGIAIVGITYVVSKLNFHDHVKVLDESKLELVDMQVVGDAGDNDPEFRVRGQLPKDSPSADYLVPRARVWTDRSDRATVDVADADAKPVTMAVRGIRPESTAADGTKVVPRLLVEHPDTHQRSIVKPAQVLVRRNGQWAAGAYRVPDYPLVDIGLNQMARKADWAYLLVALAVMPLSYLITSYRWYLLMRMLDIRITQGRAFVINMVGAFYNTLFALGSTGGDVAKAYYASKHTTHRTRAVMSVLVDRALGLLALVILGGAMAALQYHESVDCQRVAKASGLLVGVTALGLLVFYCRPLRKGLGLDWVLGRLPMQRFIHNAVHAMELYGRRPGQMGLVLLMCFPVHIITIISATFAAHAFNIPADKVPNTYYWVIIPVITLVGAIPISPQGAGVMEFFAIKLLTAHHPVSVGQAVALVMAVRLAQMFWNLVAGVFVLRGGYHAPTEAEQHELEVEVDTEDDEDDEPAAQTAAPVPATPLPAAGPSVGS